MKVFVLNKKRAVSYLALLLCAIGILALGTVQSADVYQDGGEKMLPIYCVDRGDEKVVSLTFDAAWDDTDTDILIRILKNTMSRLRFLWWEAGFRNIRSR